MEYIIGSIAIDTGMLARQWHNAKPYIHIFRKLATENSVYIYSTCSKLTTCTPQCTITRPRIQAYTANNFDMHHFSWVYVCVKYQPSAVKCRHFLGAIICTRACASQAINPHHRINFSEQCGSDAKIAATSTNNSIRLYTRVNLGYYHTIYGHEKPLTGVKFSPSDPNLVYSSSLDGTIR